MTKKFYIGECLQVICGLLTDVSENVFSDHRPEAKGKQMQDMVVVSLPVTVNDNNVQQDTVIRFELMARNKSTGIANITRLQQMLDTLTAKFPIVSGRYSFVSPTFVLKGNDGLGYTVWNVQARLIINTTDNYNF